MLCKLFQDIDGRLNYTNYFKETHIISKFTLRNTKPEDTGYFECRIFMAEGKTFITSRQYVYSHKQLVILQVQDIPKYFIAEAGRPFTVPCKPTHPNVTFSLFHENIYRNFTFVNNERFSKVSLLQTHSEWSFDPKRGFTIKETRIKLYGDLVYLCTASVNVINGKRVYIPPKTD
uniref:Ig-like domain-containing protein n=1 Tax=Daphnia galeata TaxID=27404 RepID=A0A8J2W3X2_9CRUS|nr:unnamed protein product [Daphnia galeata]